MKTWRK